MRQGVQLRLGDRAVRKTEPEPDPGHEHRADRAQGGRGLRIEPLERFRESPIALPHDRAEEVLRALRIRLSDLLHRAVEKSEDPTDLLFEEGKARRAEAVELLLRPYPQRLGGDGIRGFEIGPETGKVGGDRDRILPFGFKGGSESVFDGHRDAMITLPFFVRNQRDAKGED